MKSRVLIALGLLILASVTLPSVGQEMSGPSFRQQLVEMISLHDAGLISDEELRIMKSRLLLVMMH